MSKEPNVQSEREAFEAEQIRHVQAYSYGRHLPHLERTGDGYQNPLVQASWQGWQARALLASRPIPAQAGEQEAPPKDTTPSELLGHMLDWHAAVTRYGAVSETAKKHFKAIVALLERNQNE